MLGYRLFSNNEKEAGHRLSYSKTNITKVKGSFLYTERKKYFDFTSAINMGAFGYNNKFTTARLKESLTKNHSYLTSLSQVKNYLNPLYRHYPSLREYDCYPLSDSQLSDWLLENFSHCQIHKEPIEENILTSLMERNNLQSNQNKEKKKNIKWVTDLNYFYQLLDSSNARHTRHTEDMEHTEDTEKTQEPRISSSHKGIILNSFFPHALHYFFSSNADIESKLKFENTEKEDFDFILYRNANSVENYSEVTYGISNCVLLFVKKEASVSESPITKPNNQYLISLDYSRATIKKALNKMYFKKEISEKKSSSQNHSLKKNRFNRQTKPLEQSLQILEKENRYY